MAKEPEVKLDCLEENTKRYEIFLIIITKEAKSFDENGEETIKVISYRLQLTDIEKFMATAISNLADNLVEEIYKIKSKYGHDRKKMRKFWNQIKIL